MWPQLDSLRAAAFACMQRNPLAVFDFDGTLAPIVSDASAAAPRPSTAALLAYLIEILPCAVVSCRSREDLGGRLGGLQFRAVVGNHGAEWDRPLPSDPAARRDVQAWMRELAPVLATYPNSRVEDKGLSLTLHHDGLLPLDLARVVTRLEGARIVPGIRSVNLIPSRLPNKGDAVLRLRARFGAGAVVYVGDDASDEDVFRLGGAIDLLSVRVGASALSHARYFLRSQAEVDDLLRLLVKGASHARLSA